MHPTGATLLDNIEHVANVGGEDHVSIGTDGGVLPLVIDAKAREDARKAYQERTTAGIAAPGEGPDVFTVVEVDIKYRKPARLSDDLLVISTVDQVRASSVLIHQRVMRGKEQLTDARVTAAFLDGEGRPRRQPRDWVEKFNAITSKGQ